jgi:hypothetical protein
MKTAIELHELAEMGLPLSATTMRTALPRPTPQPRGQQPPPQRLVIDRDAVFTREVLRRQRRAKALVHAAAVFLAHQRQHLLPQPPWRRPIRGAAHAPMLQPARTFGPIPAIQALRLPVAHRHHRRRRSQRQRSRRDPCQHASPLQLRRTHCRPPQSTTSTRSPA